MAGDAGMCRVTCVAFRNRRKETLSGILHEPDRESARGVCVLLLSPGIKGRVGPHRLYLKIAARLVPMGFHVLRFDYSGLGDSGGMLAERDLVDVYVSVQNGRYVDDTIAAMNWMEQTHGVSDFVASGLCGGALSGLLTAETDARIRSLVCLGIPAAYDGSREHWGKHLTGGQLDQLRSGYLRRLAHPSAWLRFLSGKSSYGVIWQSLRRAVGAGSRAAGSSEAGETGQPSWRADNDNANPRFAQSFLSVLESGRPALLIFSGADRLGLEFEEKFAVRHAARLEAVRGCYAVHTIDGANHVLSNPAWVSEFLEISARWLDRHHPAA